MRRKRDIQVKIKIKIKETTKKTKMNFFHYFHLEHMWHKKCTRKIFIFIKNLYTR